MKKFIILTELNKQEDGSETKEKWAICVDSIWGVKEDSEGGCTLRFKDADEEAYAIRVEGTVEELVKKFHEIQEKE